MTWTIRSAIATLLWVAAGLLTFFFVISGWWLLLPFALAGGGGRVLFLAMAIVALGILAYFIGRGSAADGLRK